MDRIGRGVAVAIINSSLLFAAACGGPEPAANQNAEQPAQSGTPLVLPKNQSKPGMGSIKIGSRPAGAAIMLISEGPGGSSKPEPRGSTPTTIVDLSPGKYTVHLELRPYKAFQKIVEVNPDETTTVIAELER